MYTKPSRAKGDKKKEEVVCDVCGSQGGVRHSMSGKAMESDGKMEI